MKLTINPSKLLSGIKKINQVIDKKPSLAILSNVLFTFNKENDLTLRGSNGEIDLIIKRVEYTSVEEAQNMCVDCAKLAGILATINDENITLRTKDNTLSIKHSKGTIKIPLYDIAEYPQLNPISEEAKKIVIPSADNFKSYLTRVIPFTGDDTLRMVMMNVLMEIKDNSITLVASDTHKLIASRIPYTTTDDIKLLIPPRASKLIADTTAKQITVWAEGKRNTFVCDNIIISHRVIEGRYPNWEMVIPKNNSILATVDSNSIQDSLKRLNTLSANTDFIKLSCDSQTKKMDIELQDMDFAVSGNEELEMSEYSGGNICISFHTNDLLQVFAGISGNATVEMSEPHKAAVIHDDNTTVLLMPLSL